MKYIIDTCAFRVLSHYYPSQFPSLWLDINKRVASGEILSVREVYREMEDNTLFDGIREWLTLKRHIFMKPTAGEVEIIKNIFSNKHYQQLLSKRNILNGMPVADPFLIASAKFRKGVVVTEEKNKDNSAKIPTICEAMSIKCIGMIDFLKNNNMCY